MLYWGWFNRPRHPLLRLLLTALGGSAVFGSAFGLELSALTNADASAGMKKALNQGIDLAADKLGVADGLLKNPKVKIDLPPNLEKAEGMMPMPCIG